MTKTLWAVWSFLVVWPLAFAWMALDALLSFLVLPFLRFERFQAVFPHRMLAMVPWLVFSPVHVRYHARFDPKRVCVFAANHTSMLDAHVCLAALHVPLCGVMNWWHLKVPAYGWLMRLGNAIPIYPQGENKTSEVTAAARERASRGISILVFPEAHRTLDGKLRPFKRGVFFMARDAGLPIVPLATRGLYTVMPKGRYYMRPGRIEVWVGPPVETAGLTDAQIGELAERVRQYVAAFAERGEIAPDELLP